MTLPPALARFAPGTLARLGLACIGAVSAGFILLCLGVLLQARRDATAAAEMQARNIAASVAQDVARNLEIYDLSLQAVVQGLQIPGVMALTPPLRRMILFQRAARAPYFGFINVLDAKGTVTDDSESASPRDGNYRGRDYFTAQRDDARDVLFIGAPFLTQAGKSPTISISRRRSNPDGSFAGVVVGTMRLAYFRDLFLRLNLGRHGTIALLRHDGMILMRLPFNADDIGRTLPPDAPFYRAQDGASVDAIDPTDRRRRRFLFLPVGTLPLVVAVGLADTDIYAAWRGKAVALGLAMAALGAIDLGLLLVLGFALARREQGEAALHAGHAQLTALAEERRQALAVMAQTAAAKTRFLATMSHELRTPLNSMLGYAELLALDGMLAPAQASRLAAMRGAGEHLRDVINRVLDFSRVVADDHPPLAQRTDLDALAGQCRAIAAPMAAAKGLALSQTVAPTLPRFVLADAAAIRQVVLNLLSNAIKFTGHGNVALLVTPGATGIRFAVTDTGMGVPSAQRDRLFQPYERLDADRIGVAGTGLGLAIAARLVAQMGGRIGHQDNPDGGSVFWFELPLPEAPAGSGMEPPAVETPPCRPLRVLLADDSALNRDVAASFLRRAGHTVAEAEDGEAAVCHVAAEDFDVVLMDLRMPRLDGIEATRRIRTMPGPRGRTPVVALTAQVNEDGGAALRAAGFQACLVKPIDQRSLLAAVAAVSTGQVVPPGLDQPPPAPTPGVATQFVERTDGQTMDRHLVAFAGEVGRLVDLLDGLAPGRPLSDLAHRIAGDAGQLGYMALSSAARRFEAGWDRQDAELPALADGLRRVAAEVLEAVNQRCPLARRAAMVSAKLP